jgi:hypothetical protein
MLMEQLLCITTTVVGLGENPICKEKGILARRRSFDLGNNLVYDDKLFNVTTKYIDQSSFASWRSLLTTMVIFLENEMILV